MFIRSAAVRGIGIFYLEKERMIMEAEDGTNMFEEERSVPLLKMG